jgi:hypothetical protein
VGVTTHTNDYLAYSLRGFRRFNAWLMIALLPLRINSAA